MRRCLIWGLLLGLLLPSSACARSQADVRRRLTVFAAASLTDAFTEIGRVFEQTNPGTQVTFSFSSSRTLRTQIEAGAPADVFASANIAEMDALVNSGLIRTGAPKVFLTNRLAVILPGTNPAGVHDLGDLAKPRLKLVLATEEVPVGAYAREALAKMNASLGEDFAERTLSNVVSNEDNVRQVVAKVQLGEADAGIVYASDAVAVPDLITVEIPAQFNVIAEYPIGVLAGSNQPDLAGLFVDYVLSDPGQAILARWGFSPTG